ncbi:MAG: hypothetical protein IJS86_02345 [Lachnospiraceae bacterium]|nr:hypothetical protein [Lachnospiraceae bacterium]
MDEKKVLLNDDDLGIVSGGVEIRDDAQAGGRCPQCAALLQKNNYGVYACPQCHPEQFSKNSGMTPRNASRNLMVSGGPASKPSVFDRGLRKA